MLVICDVETTGLDPRTSGVWDLAAVAVQDGRIISRFETLVWPGREMLQPHHRDVMQRISGMDPVRLLDADVPAAEDARELLLGWLDSIVPLTSYPATSFNVPFDSGFLNAPPWAPTCFTWGPCVMEAAARRLLNGSRIALPKACRHLGVEFTETHRALADAEAAAKLAILLRLEGAV